MNYEKLLKNESSNLATHPRKQRRFAGTVAVRGMRGTTRGGRGPGAGPHGIRADMNSGCVTRNTNTCLSSALGEIQRLNSLQSIQTYCNKIANIFITVILYLDRKNIRLIPPSARYPLYTVNTHVET